MEFEISSSTYYIYGICIALASFRGAQVVMHAFRSRKSESDKSGWNTKEIKKIHAIPSAPWVPLLGSVPFLGRHPCRTISKWGAEKKLGNIFRVKFGRLDAVILNDFDAIHQCFVRHSHLVAGRQQNPLVVELWKGNGLLFLDYGDKWKSQSVFCHSSFRKVLGNGKIQEIAIAESKVMAKALHMQLSNQFTSESNIYGNHRKTNLNCNQNNCPCVSASYHSRDQLDDEWTCLNPLQILNQALANVVCRVLFGRNFKPDETEYCDVVAETPIQARKSFEAFMAAYLIPVLRRIPPFRGIINEALELRYATFKMIRDIVEERANESARDGDKSEFIDMYLDKITQEQSLHGDSTFTVEQLHATLFDIFTAGSETSSSTLMWALLYLARDEDLHGQIRDEIKNALAYTGGEVTEELIPYLNLTRAVLHETVRIRPILALGVPHTVTKDCDIAGYRFSAGTVVMPNVWAVHHNEKQFPEPDVFDPKRHLNENGKFTNSKYVVGFSIGTRKCLGRKVAEVGMLYHLVALVRDFEFRLPRVWSDTKKRYETMEIDLSGIEGQILLPPTYCLEWKVIPPRDQ